MFVDNHEPLSSPIPRDRSVSAPSTVSISITDDTEDTENTETLRLKKHDTDSSVSSNGSRAPLISIDNCINTNIQSFQVQPKPEVPKKLKIDSDDSGDDDFLLDFSKTIKTTSKSKYFRLTKGFRTKTGRKVYQIRAV